MSNAEQAAQKVVPTPFEITDLPHNGKTATNGKSRLVAIDEGTKVFRRRAIRPNGDRIEWIVAELDGVRVYFDGTDCVVTRKDMLP